MEQTFKNINLIDLIKKWGKTLIIVIITTAIISSIISFIIPEKFKSTAIVYPANITPFSTETETEQMLQILHSMDIKASLIKKFDLFKHYNIDPKNSHAQTAMLNNLDANITITKTQYESVMIEVMDKNKDTACYIANSILDFYNKKNKQLHKEKSIERLNILTTQLQEKREEMDSLENRLQTIRKDHGVLDYAIQTEEGTKGLLKLEGLRNNHEAQKLLTNLQEKGGEYLAINEHLWRVRGDYNDLKKEYENVKQDVVKKITYAHIITKPQPADKKAYPIRWLIVSISVISTTLLTLILIAGIENYNRIKQ